MAQITRTPLVRHLRSEPTMHTLHYRRGRLARSGPGLAFWFRPLSTGVAEVPLDDRDLPFLFHGRTADFQDVTTQGTITYRVAEPERLAARVDFTLDIDTGTFVKTPLEQVAGLLTQLAQQFVYDYVVGTQLREILTHGVAEIRTRIGDGLRAEPALEELGLAVAAVRVSAVSPTPDVEKALQTPSRERIQQDADQATFERRAQAVQKERAIAENELQNQIELARREESLVTQQGQNERMRATEAAAAQEVQAEAAGRRTRVEAEARADSIKAVEGARVSAEGDRAAIYRDVTPAVLFGLAAQELAGKLKTVEHLNVTPDLLAPLLANLAEAGTRRLEAPEEG